MAEPGHLSSYRTLIIFQEHSNTQNRRWRGISGSRSPQALRCMRAWPGTNTVCICMTVTLELFLFQSRVYPRLAESEPFKTLDHWQTPLSARPSSERSYAQHSKHRSANSPEFCSLKLQSLAPELRLRVQLRLQVDLRDAAVHRP